MLLCHLDCEYFLKLHFEQQQARAGLAFCLLASARATRPLVQNFQLCVLLLCGVVLREGVELQPHPPKRAMVLKKVLVLAPMKKTTTTKTTRTVTMML